MSIESEQDKKNYKETSKTSGLSVSYTPGSAVTVSGGKGKTNTDSTYESVTKQAGIYAGKEGYDIQVKNNTHLKGGIIDSKAPAEKNKLTTGTLTWENIDNKAEYKTNRQQSGIQNKRKRNLLQHRSRNPLKCLRTPFKHGSHRERQRRNNHEIRRSQRNHNHHR